ncbi:MAG: PIG-L family deacetylase [Oscillatoriophycideae cyanobacterium NC_groundwater_1537_Pr4_S-0.65um_50_18]|nr:PIG-L family deacetylase [Oscillatoriophycideae cyanobacterium NC_groundwater_1537_Pr4_S-0.65um_50_18]
MLRNADLESSVLSSPETLPLYSIERIAQSPVLVVAPHPDDECLGCGGAIALLQSLGCNVQILVVSDGAMSHPNSHKYPAAVLRSLRAAETQSAMQILGIEASHIQFLGLPDGAVPTPEDPGFDEAVLACWRYLEAIAPQVIFLPWRQDPHADHRATWQILQAALQQSHSGISTALRILEYPIWDWDLTQRGDGLNPEMVNAWRLDIQTVVELKQEAIAAYRSQTTELIDDDPQGFRLSADMLKHFSHPWEIYLENQP